MMQFCNNHVPSSIRYPADFYPSFHAARGFQAKKRLIVSEQVEWEIVQMTPLGLKRHTEGAQSRFGLTRAKKIAKALGEPWYVIHHATQLMPDEQPMRWSP